MFRGDAISVLAVVAMVLVAGCGGTGSDTPTNDGNGANVTSIAPGIGENAGLVNHTALLWSHRRSLNETGFTYRFRNNRTNRVVYPNESPSITVDIAERGRVAARAGLSSYLVNETDRSTDPPTVMVQYVGPDGGGERTVRGGNETVVTYSEEATVLLTEHYLMGNFLDQGNWTVTERRGDSIVLEAGPAWSAWEVEHAGDTMNISTRTFFDGEMVVSRDGRIRRLTVNKTSVERIRENGTFHSRGITIRRFEYELLETNGTDVERPPWVPAARNGTATDTAPRDGTATAD